MKTPVTIQIPAKPQNMTVSQFYFNGNPNEILKISNLEICLYLVLTHRCNYFYKLSCLSCLIICKTSSSELGSCDEQCYVTDKTNQKFALLCILLFEQVFILNKSHSALGHNLHLFTFGHNLHLILFCFWSHFKHTH